MNKRLERIMKLQFLLLLVIVLFLLPCMESQASATKKAEVKQEEVKSTEDTKKEI